MSECQGAADTAAEPEADEVLVERVARAIADAVALQSDSGVYPKWSDFRDEARAAIAALAAPTGVKDQAQPGSITAELLGEVMQDAWGEICDDAGAHPDDIRREGRKTFYDPRHWTDLIALRLNERLAALRACAGGEPTAIMQITFVGGRIAEASFENAKRGATSSVGPPCSTQHPAMGEVG